MGKPCRGRDTPRPQAALSRRDAELAMKVIASDGRYTRSTRATGRRRAMTGPRPPLLVTCDFLLALDRFTYELERNGRPRRIRGEAGRKLAGNVSMARTTSDAMATLAPTGPRRRHGAGGRGRGQGPRSGARDRRSTGSITRLVRRRDLADDQERSRPRWTRGTWPDPGFFASPLLERIGDRVTNIAEDVVFLATGEVET